MLVVGAFPWVDTSQARAQSEAPEGITEVAEGPAPHEPESSIEDEPPLENEEPNTGASAGDSEEQGEPGGSSGESAPSAEGDDALGPVLEPLGPSAQELSAPTAIEPLALGTVTAPPAGAHFTRTTPGEFSTVVPETIPGYTGQVCAVTITTLAGAGGNVNDTTNAGAGNYKNGSGAAATATYPVRPGMPVTGHVGQGGRYLGQAYTDAAFATDIAGFSTMNINNNQNTQNSSRARAAGGAPDGGFGGSMPGAWWGNIRHVGAGGGGSSLVSIAGEELVMVGGGGGNGGGHSTLIGIGGDGGQPTGPGVTPGLDGSNGADSQWYQSHTNYSNVGNINENLANSGQGNRIIYWTNPYIEPNPGFVPGGGQGGQAAGPGIGGLHRINGNSDTVISTNGWTTYPTNSQYLRNQRNSLLHGFDALGRIGGNGGDDQIFFRGSDPQGLRRTTGNPDSGGGGGGGYFGGGGGASTVSYGLSISANRGVTGAGGGGGASFVSPGGIETGNGMIGAVRGIDSGLGPKALSERNGADGFVALQYSTDCGSAWKTVDLAPMSPSIVNESGEFAESGQTVKYTLHFRASSTGDYAVDHLDHLAGVLDDAEWLGNFRYGDSETVPAGQTGPYVPGIQASFDATAQTIRVTGTVPSNQIRTVSFEVRVKANFPDRLADSSGDYVLQNFLGESGTTPPEECEPEDPNCTENPILGSVIWEKVDGGGERLAGSKWRVTGPAGDGSQGLDISDCVAASATDCSGPDKDPRSGHFEVVNLVWGDYVLVETEAPAGYLLDTTEHPFSIGSSGALGVAVDLGPYENVPRPPLQIPLTGGMGADGFLIGGGALLGLLCAFAIVRARRARSFISAASEL